MYSSSGIKEGFSTVRPPLFEGVDYPYWKARITTFIKSNDLAQWRIITKGPHKITHLVDGKIIPKPEDEWTKEEDALEQANEKALNTLHCALSRDEYNKISSCKSAKEIWDKLMVSNEGTSQVKDDNINMLTHDYELFKMEPHESLESMFSRFIVLTNDLSCLGKEFSNYDKVRKMLRVLPVKWRPKVTAIQEAKDLHKLSLDELMGSLKTHEKELERETKTERNLKPMKNLALEVSNEDHEDEDDMALMSRKFAKFLAKKNRSKEGDKRRCFNCQEKGHFEANCPKKKKRSSLYKKMKKCLQEASSDPDEEESESESSEEEHGNLCLTAFEDANVELHNKIGDRINRKEKG